MPVTVHLALLLALPATAQAHAAWDTGPLSHLPVWGAQALLLALWIAGLAGAARVRPRLGERLAFHAATAVTAVALFGPFDERAATSTAMHMVQHMLLMVVAAPLWVLARPLPAWRAALGPWVDPWWQAVLRAGRHPVACAALHAAAIWAWHLPQPYLAAVGNNWWHVAEHASFAFSAWLFWWAVLRARRGHEAQAALALLFTLMHTGLLGALLTFARAPLYAPESRDLWDQQLAGLLMWVPGGAAYLAAAAWCAHRWLGRLQRAVPAGPQRTP